MNAITTPELRACNTDASLINACELNSLGSDIRSLNRHFLHIKGGISIKVRKLICRKLDIDALENLPRSRIAEVTRLLEWINDRAISNKVAMDMLEQRFVGQLFGVGDE